MQRIERVVNKQNFKSIYGKKKFLNATSVRGRTKLMIGNNHNKYRAFVPFKSYDGKTLDSTYHLVLKEGYELVDGADITEEFERDYYVTDSGSIVKKEIVENI